MCNSISYQNMNVQYIDGVHVDLFQNHLGNYFLNKLTCDMLYSGHHTGYCLHS